MHKQNPTRIFNPINHLPKSSLSPSCAGNRVTDRRLTDPNAAATEAAVQSSHGNPVGRRFSLSIQWSSQIAGAPITDGRGQCPLLLSTEERPLAPPCMADGPWRAVFALIGDPCGSPITGRGEASGLSVPSALFFFNPVTHVVFNNRS